MDKKDFQNLFKAYMKERGFKIKGNCAYQFIDDQYIIGIYLDHHPLTTLSIWLASIVIYTIKLVAFIQAGLLF